MSVDRLALVWRIQSLVQITSMIAVAAGATALAAGFALGLAGAAPVIDLPVRFPDGATADIGLWAEGAAALAGLLLLAYMPANWRVLRLEAAHRDFRIGMEDVTRAYREAHRADRAGRFTTSREYDQVRERLMFLRDHPDLGALEPDILEVAAQMSQASEELARRYSDDAIARAKSFLAERQAEAQKADDRIEAALTATREIRRWHERVTIDEDVAKSRIDQLVGELDVLLPEIGLPRVGRRVETSSAVIQLPAKTGKRPPRAQGGK